MTRGCYGFFLKNVFYVAVVDTDAVPKYLGVVMTAFCRRLSDKDICYLKSRVPELHFNNDGYANVSAAATGSNLLMVLEGRDVDWEDGRAFLQNSLYCEWAHVLNLDDLTLDVYRGFQEMPTPSNPLGISKNRFGYYPVKRIATYPIAEIPAGWWDVLNPHKDEESGENVVS